MAWGKKVNMGSYTPDELEFKAYHWCINNNIYISPFAKNEAAWYIDIVNKGVQHRSPETYSWKELYKNIFKFYLYYYEKYSNKKQFRKTV